MKPLISNTRALSLVELLTTLAVIAVVTAIAIPNIANLSNSADTAKNRQNAQYIVSVASAVRAAGYTNAWIDEDALIDDLTTGITYRNMTFSISPLSADEIAGAKGYFQVLDGQAFYESTTP